MTTHSDRERHNRPGSDIRMPSEARYRPYKKRTPHFGPITPKRPFRSSERNTPPRPNTRSVDISRWSISSIPPRVCVPDHKCQTPGHNTTDGRTTGRTNKRSTNRHQTQTLPETRDTRTGTQETQHTNQTTGFDPGPSPYPPRYPGPQPPNIG